MSVAVHFRRSNNNVTANYASIRDCDGVWTGIYSAASAGSGYRDVNSDNDDNDDDDDGDGIDPLNFWRYKGAPADMQGMVKRSDEEMMRQMKERICHWVQAVLDAVEDGDASGEEEQKSIVESV